MPTYKNDRTDQATIRNGGFTFLAGLEVQTDRYLVSGDLTFMSHDPAVTVQPIKGLKDTNLVDGESVFVDLNYPKVQVRNESGQALRVSFNGTSGETIYIENNESQIFNQRFDNKTETYMGNIGSLRLSGEGTSTINIVNLF